MKKRWMLVFALIFLGTFWAYADDIVVTPENSPTVTTSNANNYTFEGGMLTVNKGGSSVTLSGTIQNTEGYSGVLKLVGARGGSLNVSQGLQNFAGTVQIGDTGGKDTWYFLGTTNELDSSKTDWFLNTGTNSGLRLYETALKDQTVSLGGLRGDGLVRSDTENITLEVGAARSESTVDVFHGSIQRNSDDTTSLSFVKNGDGTLILTNSQKWSNDNGTCLTNVNNWKGATTISKGTLQIGDYGHVYAAGDPYFTEGTVGLGATGAIQSSSAIVIEADGKLAFARSNGDSSSLKFSNGITFNGGAISNLNPDCAIVLSSAITGTNGFTKTGAGTIAVTKNSGDVSGKVTINEGTFQLGYDNSVDGALSQTKVTYEVNANGKLAFARSNKGDPSLEFTNDITFNGGAISNVNPDCAIVLSGTMTGTNGFTKTGEGTIAVTANSSGISGTVTINEGTFQLGYNNSTSGALAQTKVKYVVNANGTFAVSRTRTPAQGTTDIIVPFSNAFELNGGKISNTNAAALVQLTGSLAGTGFTKVGVGTIELIPSDNAAMTSAYAITIQEGALRTNSGTALGAATLTLDGGILQTNPSVSFTISNAIQMTENGGEISNLSSSKTMTLSGVLSGTGFKKTGKGRVVLSGTNTLSSEIQLQEGTLAFSKQTQSGTGNLGNATLVFDGGTLECQAGTESQFLTMNKATITANGGRILVNNQLYLNGLRDADGETGGTLTVSGNNNKYFHLGLSGGDASADFTKFHGTIRTEEKTTLTLQSQANLTTVALDLANAGSTIGLFVTGNTTSTAYQVGDLFGTANLQMKADNTKSLEVGSLNQDSTYSGAMTAQTAGQTLNVTKVGSGTWTLGSSDVTGVGDVANAAHITVGAGTLELARKENVASAKNLTIASGASLLLSTENQAIAGAFTTDENSRIIIDMKTLENSNDPTNLMLLDTASTSIDDATRFLFAYDLNDLTPNTSVSFDRTKIIDGLVLDLEKYDWSISGGGYWMAPVVNGNIVTFSANASAIPEPSCGILLALLLPWLLSRKRKNG